MFQTQFAHALVSFKSLDDDARVIEGVASTPTLDRGGDIMDPAGAQFKLPMPLLWQHQADKPIGKVLSASVTTAGIKIRAQIAKGVLPFIDEAWALIKAGLVQGLSIGWRPLAGSPSLDGFHYTKWDWFELSAVTIPMNAETNITAVKSADVAYLAALGTGGGSQQNTPGASGNPVVKVLPSRPERQMKSIQDQILSYKSTRDQKFGDMQALMTKSSEAGETLDEADGQAYEGLESEIAAIDKHIKRLESFQEAQKALATPVSGGDPMSAHASRGGQQPVVHVKSNLPPGIEFAMAVVCKAQALNYGGYTVDYAKQMFPDRDRVQAFLKAAVPAATTTHTTYAAPLVDPTNLAGEFIEFLRPSTIIGKFGTNGIPALRKVPFNVRMNGQTSGGDAYWVGEGAPKPLTKFDFNATTLTITKIASISVLTEELIKLSSPNALDLIRDGLRDANVERADIDFIDPTVSAIAGVSPASITNGLTPMTSSGTTADNARADYARIIKAYLDSNNRPRGLVIIMPDALALSLSVMVNSLGQREFPDLTMEGGKLLGVPVITSQYAANQSGAGNLVIAVNAPDVFLADDGAVDIAMSREASLQMLDNPTNSSAVGTATTMVSMFQTDSVAVRAHRHINWAKRRAGAAVYMDDVNWGSIGSPA